MTPAVLISVVLGVMLGAAEPLPLRHSLSLALEPGQRTAVRVPAGSLVKITSSRLNLRVLRQVLNNDGARAEIRVPLERLFREGEGVLPVSVFQPTTLLVEAVSDTTVVGLERLDPGDHFARGRQWYQLERRLIEWVNDGDRGFPNLPTWLDIDVLQHLSEIALMVQVFDDAHLADREARAVLRMATERALAQQRPLVRPWYASEPLELGGTEPDMVLSSGTSMYRSLPRGQRLTLDIEGPSIVELDLLSATPDSCVRLRIDSPALIPRSAAVGCDDSPATTTLRLAVGDSTAITLTALEGEVRVRGSVSWRRHRTLALVAKSLISGAGSVLYRAELARLTGELETARQLFVQLGSAVQQVTPIVLYAQLRAAQLQPEVQAALAGLLAALAQPEVQDNPPMAEVVAGLAIQRARDQQAWDELARMLGLADSVARTALARNLSAPLAAELVSHLVPAGWREPGTGVLLHAHGSRPDRADVARAARSHARRFGQWRRLAFRSSREPVLFLEPARLGETPGPLGDPRALARLGDNGGDIRVLEDPLGLGRWPRVRLAMQALPDAPWQRLTVDGQSLVVPTLEPIAVFDLAMAPGRHTIESNGIPVYVRAEVIGEQAGAARLQEYVRLGAQPPASAELPEIGLPGSLLLTFRWSHPGDRTHQRPAEIEVCMAELCQQISLFAGPNERNAPHRISVRLPVPAAADALAIRQTGDDAAVVWARAALLGRRQGEQRGTLESGANGLRRLEPREAHDALAAIEQALATDPSSAPLLAQRGEIMLILGRGARARRDLRAAARVDRRAATLQRLLGPRGRWLAVKERGSPRPFEALVAEQLIEPGPRDRELLPQLRRQVAGAAQSDPALLEPTTELLPEQSPLATLFYARRSSHTDPIAAADLLLDLATRQARAASLLRVEAARLRLRSRRPLQVRQAYVDALEAGGVPGAAAVRREAERLSQWQPIFDVERSAGVASWTADQPPGQADRSRTYRGHVATPAQPVEVTVLGPTVARLTLRAVLSQPRPRIVRVNYGGTVVAEVRVDTADGPAVQSVPGTSGRPLFAVRRLVALAGSGAARLSVSPDRGQVLVRLAVRAARGDSLPRTTTTASVVPTPRGLPASRRAIIAATLAKRHGEAPSALEQQASHRGHRSSWGFPVTARTTFELRGPFRDRGAPHCDSEPFLGITAQMHRRLADELWASGGPEIRLRSDAEPTARLRGRIDVGAGSGLRLALAGDAAHQRVDGDSGWGARLRGRAGWELELMPSLALYADLSFVRRWVAFTRLPADGTDVDPLVYSTYARDHQRSIEGRARASLRPTTDLVVRATGTAVSNAILGTLDHYRLDLEALATIPPFFGRIRLRRGRRLADSHRFLPYSVNRLYTRVGIAFWLWPGNLLAVEAADRLELDTMTHALTAKLTYTLSWDRLLADVPPALVAHRSQWESVAPLDERDFP